MAKWIVNGERGSIILTPKVASRSFADTFGADGVIKHDRVAICLRHPLDRIAAVLSDKRTVNHSKTGPFTNPCDDHMAPQVDYLNWRYNNPVGTHQKIPVGSDWIEFEPDFVFILEAFNYRELLDWAGIDYKPLPKKNSHKRVDWQQMLKKRHEKRFAKDLEFYGRMCESAYFRSLRSGWRVPDAAT